MFSRKLMTSIAKIILPFLSKILGILKANSRAVNYFEHKRTISNDTYNFENLIDKLLEENKLIGLDVGAKGGFNSDKYFPKKYNKFFKSILVDPLEKTTKNEKNQYIINKGLWSSSCKKKLYVLNKRPESSSLYEPDINSLKIYNYKDKELSLFDVSKEEIIECDTLSACLEKLNIDNLDYLKIDTQGAELEILKGLGNFRPLVIKLEVRIFPMYKNEPSWSKLISLIYELGYIVTDWKRIGSSVTRAPVEMDMIFIPNFLTDFGKKLIKTKENQFTSLLLMTGQIELLKKISKIIDLKYSEPYSQIEDRYFN